MRRPGRVFAISQEFFFCCLQFPLSNFDTKCCHCEPETNLKMFHVVSRVNGQIHSVSRSNHRKATQEKLWFFIDFSYAALYQFYVCFNGLPVSSTSKHIILTLRVMILECLYAIITVLNQNNMNDNKFKYNCNIYCKIYKFKLIRIQLTKCMIKLSLHCKAKMIERLTEFQAIYNEHKWSQVLLIIKITIIKSTNIIDRL